MLNNCKKKLVGGFTLIETLLVTSIFVLILMVVFRYYESAQTAEKVREAVKIVQLVRAASADFAIGKDQSTPYAGISWTALTNYGLIPKALQGTNTNPWRGSIGVAASENGKQVTVSLGGVPVCASLAGKFSNEGTSKCASNTFSVVF